MSDNTTKLNERLQQWIDDLDPTDHGWQECYDALKRIKELEAPTSDLTERLLDIEYCVYGGESQHLGDSPDYELAIGAADRITKLETELERTRQAWVNGDDPMCDDVCLTACKGPCDPHGTA